MSTILPFAAVRYNTSASNDVSTRLSPPYDVLDERDKNEMLARDPNNFVRVDLPHTPPVTAGPESAYLGARQTLDRWLQEGVLVREPAPAIYPYYQRFTSAGREFTRKMFFARLKLEPFGTGSVFPHEKTFGGPKEDRLALMKATAATLSPIFGLYQDPDNAVSRRLDSFTSGKPTATAMMSGTDNRLWVVTDPGAITDVTRLMSTKPIFIADGHHRYGTGLLYKEWLEQQQGKLPPDHPANFVLCAFCAMEDPGLLILPTHRVLAGVALPTNVFSADANVRCTPMSASSPAAVIAELAKLGPQALACYFGKERKYVALQPANPELLAKFERDRSPAFQKLALAFLHSYLLDRVIAPKVLGGKAPEIRYIKAIDEAVTVAEQTGGTAFLMQPTTMQELRDVCSANDLMPQKSTFFYPKLASGMVVSPLA